MNVKKVAIVIILALVALFVAVMAVSIWSYTNEELIEYMVGYHVGKEDEANHLPYDPYKYWLRIKGKAQELVFEYIDEHKDDLFAQHLTIERLRDEFIRGYHEGYYHG